MPSHQSLRDSSNITEKNGKLSTARDRFSFKLAGIVTDVTDTCTSSSSSSSSSRGSNTTISNVITTVTSKSTQPSNNRTSISQSIIPPKRSCSTQSCNKRESVRTNISRISLQLNDPYMHTPTAFLTELTIRFICKVNELIKTRKIFSSNEYPKSFTGEEAVDLLILIAGSEVKRKEYKRIARMIMHSTPPVFLPINYSEKSIKNNTLYDSAKEAYTLNEDSSDNITDRTQECFPQSVFTQFLDCYTPTCSRGSNGCYAPLCPNRGPQIHTKTKILNKDLQRNISFSSSMASSQDTLVSRCWAKTIPRETLQKTPPREMKRQEAIFELIYTEEDYVRDLNLLEELFVKPLSEAQCIEHERRTQFCNDIFGNYKQILETHRDMYRDLRDHQLSSQEHETKEYGIGFVDHIGQVILRYVDQFLGLYTEYGPHFLMAEYIVKKEMSHNILFHNFIREKEKQAETRKLPFRHFIILPITRLQRYPLLLDAILKRTTDEQERRTLAICIERIRNVTTRVDRLTDDMRQTLRIRQINDKIRFKPNHPRYNLDLLRKGRKLIYEGPLKRRSHFVESVDLYVFLFDHILLMTKPKRVNSNSSNSISSSNSSIQGHMGSRDEPDYFIVSKNPIPLDLLIVGDVSENFRFGTFRANTSKTSSSNSSSGLNSGATTSSMSSLIPSSTRTSTQELNTTPFTSTSSSVVNLSSFLIRHLGQHGGEYILYTDTPSSRLIWKQKISKAQADLSTKREMNSAFQMVTISDTNFSLVGTSSHHSGKVTCAASFVGNNGMKMVALGTQHGVWIGKESDTNGLTKVLMADGVTQIGVIETHKILLVLADKILTAYPLVQLDPFSPTNTLSSKASGGKKSSDKETVISSRIISQHAIYFNTGTCNGKTLIVTMKRKKPDSQFKVYEIVCGNLSDPRNAKYLVTKASFILKPPPWFRLYKEFYVGTDSRAVHFLRSKLLVACPHGFEVIDLEHLDETLLNLPDLKRREFNFIVSSEAKPLNIFRCDDNFLLCYDKFGFLISTHGDYVVDKYKRIEWESSPQSFAFYYPYVVAFDHQFIEVRNAKTGKLVQIIIANNTKQLRSATNNANTLTSTIYGCATHDFKYDYQHIFKLEPLFS
ncbi:CNH domain-containing protein [Mycotypha africana]|uniref:CNH domain-containing protein n=1 Tax=Mycotypha africana TaxID=64632 RepID=UPI0022FFEA85|nr:CNH domain-containing protein [Mycotypha africana]KAI8977094.1 CNH domain-containing protein [Mycotypha africana]